MVADFSCVKVVARIKIPSVLKKVCENLKFHFMYTVFILKIDSKNKDVSLKSWDTSASQNL